jgi:hypothetical protein
MEEKRKAGRPRLPEAMKKKRVTITLRPDADRALRELAAQAGTSKGQIITWFVLFPGAKYARVSARNRARFPFNPPIG